MNTSVHDRCYKCGRHLSGVITLLGGMNPVCDDCHPGRQLVPDPDPVAALAARVDVLERASDGRNLRMQLEMMAEAQAATAKERNEWKARAEENERALGAQNANWRDMIVAKEKYKLLFEASSLADAQLAIERIARFADAWVAIGIAANADRRNHLDGYLEPRDYVAANLFAALALVPDTGDWHGQLRHWCEAHRKDVTPNDPGGRLSRIAALCRELATLGTS